MILRDSFYWIKYGYIFRHTAHRANVAHKYATHVYLFVCPTSTSNQFEYHKKPSDHTHTHRKLKRFINNVSATL